MSCISSLLKLGRALLVLGLAACASPAISHLPVAPAESLVQVEIYDRVQRGALPIHVSDGRRYVVGTPGHEYAVRIRNTTGARVLAVTSVDGVNVISGDTAAPSQSGYVLEPWGSVEITGWRKSFERTAAFYFTDLGDSYAARTGRPADIGIIGIAVFTEQARRPMPRERREPRSSEHPASAAAAADRPESAPASARSAADSAAASHKAPREPAALSEATGPLGTGHGRSLASRVTRVSFERASARPAQTVSIQYDRRENLAALGVLPSPRLSRRSPDPFPAALRFAPDPGH